MAITGVKSAFVAKYAATNGAYGYTGGQSFARTVDITVTAESNDAELYSDNELEESDYSFSKGTLKTTATELSSDVYAMIMGITAEEDGELVFGASIQPDCGFGFIITKRSAGVESYRAIVLPRVKFKIPEDKATTQQGKLTFQNVSLEGRISRDFSTDHAWKREQTFTTEAAALSYIKTALNITTTQSGT